MKSALGIIRIDFAPTAASELAGIYTDIAQDSPEHAGAMVDRILGRIELLKTIPYRQVARDAKGQLTGVVIHSLPIPPYMVYFRIHAEQTVVQILRIRHGARRPLKRF